MRWIKHLTLAHCDEAISAALEEHGPVIYGIYWLVIEDIAAPMEKGKFEPTAVHSIGKWAQICHCPPRIFRSSLQVLKEKSLFTSSTEGDRVRITIPNILKYKDEYSKKSGDTPELSRAEGEQIRAEGEQPISPPHSSTVPKETNFEKWAMQVYERHPKQANQILAMQALFQNFGKDETARALFDKNHKLWCLTEDWRTKPHFVPPLYKPNGTGFIPDGAWKKPPPSANGHQVGPKLEPIKDLDIYKP